MKGWFNDPQRHSLASKGIETVSRISTNDIISKSGGKRRYVFDKKGYKVREGDLVNVYVPQRGKVDSGKVIDIQNGFVTVEDLHGYWEVIKENNKISVIGKDFHDQSVRIEKYDDKENVIESRLVPEWYSKLYVEGKKPMPEEGYDIRNYLTEEEIDKHLSGNK